MLVSSSGRLVKGLVRDKSSTKKVYFIPNFHVFEESGLISYFIHSVFVLSWLKILKTQTVTYNHIFSTFNLTLPAGLHCLEKESNGTPWDYGFVFKFPFSLWSFYSLNTNHKLSSLKIFFKRSYFYLWNKVKYVWRCNIFYSQKSNFYPTSTLLTQQDLTQCLGKEIQSVLKVEN